MEVVTDLKACPYCGEEDFGVMGKIIKGEVALGKMDKEAFGFASAAVYTLIDPKRPPISGARIPSARVFTDLCRKCGRAVNFRIEEGHATLPLRAGDPPVFS